MKLAERDLATILAALRLWQDSHNPTRRQKPLCELHQWLNEIATDGGSFERLSRDEVDDLCDRLNQGDDQPAREAKITRVVREGDFDVLRRPDRHRAN